MQEHQDARRVHVVRIRSNIIEDDFEEGLGTSTGCGLSDEPVGQTFDSMAQAIHYLSRCHGLPSDESDYEVLDGPPDRIGSQVIVTARQCANHADAQNGGWFDPTPDEIEAWKKGQAKLYSEEYTVEFFYR